MTHRGNFRRPGRADAWQRAWPWLTAALTALLVSRPLLPSEAVAWRGDGLLWAIGSLLLLAAVWTAAAAGRQAWRWRSADVLLLLYLAWYAASALWAIRHAAPRPAMNMLCEQAALAALYFAARRVLTDRRQQRSVLAAMMGLAAALSVYGLYQYFVTLPATRAHYHADPDAALREIGQWFPPDSKERFSFEQRLASLEPMATFALANSLAGFLTPWLVLAVGVLLAPGDELPPARRRGWALALVPWLACLLLTKSRSGYAGALLGAALVVAVLPGWQRLRSRRWLIGGVVALVALVGALGWQGGLDWLVLSEAPKSLGYRWEYWQGALGVACEYPLLGCGPGNFADTYTRFKFPTSSEEVADPHNFPLEVAAVAGWPALALLLGFLAAVFWPLRRSAAGASTDVAKPASLWPALVGAGGGFALALLAAPLVGAQVDPLMASLGAAIVGGACYLLRPWIERADTTDAPLLAACAALLVNLLAAGGFGFPAVAGSFWLLAALIVNRREGVAETAQPSVRGTSFSAVGSWLAPLGALAAAALAIALAYRPALESQALIAQAEHHGSSAAARYAAATQADPWSDEAWRRLAAVRFDLWLVSKDPADLADFRQAAEAASRVRPNSSAWRLEVADRLLAAYRRAHDPPLLDSAIREYQRAIELYPNNALRRARLAVALEVAGRLPEAAEAAREALRLHGLTPHVEHWLSPDQQRQMQDLADGAPG